jgi:hypothetical protein
MSGEGRGQPLPANVLAALSVAKRLAYSLDNVRAVDYGPAFEKGRPTGRPSIRFHMTRKVALSKLPKDQRLPATIEGIEVDVVAAGYSAHDGGSPRAPQAVLHPGVSIGNRKVGTTGTLGTFVRDLSTGRPSLLSNWHVLCGGPEAAPNDEIAQPGPNDMPDGRTVGLLVRWLRLGEHYDAALAQLSEGVQADDTLFGTTVRPAGTAAPSLGMRLVKSGATSGITHGVIDGLGGSYAIDYTGFGDGPQWMEGFRIVPDPEAPAANISLAGDSGSLWVDAATGAAVGLHFGGEEDGSPLNEYALAHPIADIFSRLNVNLS